jgi:hypothetical protein
MLQTKVPFIAVLFLVLGIKEMGHGELTTTSFCSSFMPLSLLHETKLTPR